MNLSANDLLRWLLTPAPAPWDTKGQITGKTSAVEVLGTSAILIPAGLLTQYLHVQMHIGNVQTVFAPILAIVVANVLYMFNRPFSYDEAIRTTAWLLRATAIAIIFLVGCGIFIKIHLNPHANASSWYCNFLIVWSLCNLFVGITAAFYIQSQQPIRDRVCLVFCVLLTAALLWGLNVIAPKPYAPWWDNSDFISGSPSTEL